jgi:hypothetical protein
VLHHRAVSRRLALFFAASAVLATAGARAQAPSPVQPSDRTTIAACIAESGRMPRSCVGSVAVVCARQAPGDRRDAEVACMRREAAAWRERLDAGAAMLAQRLASGPRSRLAAVQRSWEGYAAQKCAFVGEVQAPPRAAVMQAGCELHEVAARAIEVERLARAQAGPQSQRPQIER